MGTVPIRSPQAQREVSTDSPIRRARTCYDHLAGVAGVELFGEMVRRGWITKTPGGNHPSVSLTPAGEDALAERGVNVGHAKKATRGFGYGCLDWTERQHHLGGALGAQILIAMQAARVVKRHDEDRIAEVVGSAVEWLDA